MATGTIYNLFSGKKSILHFVLLSTFDQEYLKNDVTLPVKEVEISLLRKYLQKHANDLFSKIEFVNKKMNISFLEMISLIFDNTSLYHVAYNLINYNNDVLGELSEDYGGYVRKLHKCILTNMMYYIEQGEVRQIELPFLHIQNIVEGITWWSMSIPYQELQIEIPVEKAKEILLDILKHAYLKKV